MTAAQADMAELMVKADVLMEAYRRKIGLNADSSNIKEISALKGNTEYFELRYKASEAKKVIYNNCKSFADNFYNRLTNVNGRK